MLIKAVLTYEPDGIGREQSVPIGATADARLLHDLRNRVLEDAWEEAERWRDADAGLYAMKMAEAERLGRVLRMLLPDEEERPPLHVVKHATKPPAPAE